MWWQRRRTSPGAAADCPVSPSSCMQSVEPAYPRSSGTRGEQAEGRPSCPRTLEVGAALRDPSITVQACDTPGGCRPCESPTWKQPEAGGEPNAAQPGEHHTAGKVTGCPRADAASCGPAGRQGEPFGAM